jgi:AcrR family transcriptional regulator
MAGIVVSRMQHSAPRTARARVRDELTREIKEVARHQLAAEGTAALSLRAVARETGMGSSTVYRYFPSLDQLLTALIVDAYDAVGAAAEQAESAVRRADVAGRWMSVVRAVRAWAVTHPQEYALIFGSPVGYQAPSDTVDPAVRIPLLVLQILGHAVQSGRILPPDDRPIPRAVHADLKSLRDTVAPTLSDQHLARALAAWTQLVGSIGFELFGHLNNVIHDYECYFNYQMSAIAQNVGLKESPTASSSAVVPSPGRAGVNPASRGEMAGQVDSSGRAG